MSQVVKYRTGNDQLAIFFNFADIFTETQYQLTYNDFASDTPVFSGFFPQ